MQASLFNRQYGFRVGLTTAMENTYHKLKREYELLSLKTDSLLFLPESFPNNNFKTP